MIQKYRSNLKFFFLASLLFLFFISLASAQNSDERVIIKQVTDFDLKRPCFENGTYCTVNTNCTLTLTRADGSLIINNANMTNQDSYHNFTLTKAQTSISGLGEGIMSCTNLNNGLSGEDTFDVLFSPSGTDDDSLRNIILLSFGFLFSVGMLLFGFNREDPWIVMFGSMALFVFGLYTLLNGVGNYRNSMTEWTSLIVLGIAGYVSIRTGVEAMNVL